MKTLKDIEKIIQKKKEELKEKYGLIEIGIFCRQPNTKSGDLSANWLYLSNYVIYAYP